MITPIFINLATAEGLRLRTMAAAAVLAEPNTTGAERGKLIHQQIGRLGEMVVRTELGFDLATPEDQPLDFDIQLPSGVRMDVKTRGGTRRFEESYAGSGGIVREAKHNLYARQLYDAEMRADIYLFCHMQIPSSKKMPGTRLQRNWRFWICGWVSKERALRSGVYIPRGGLSERGSTWFQYTGQEVEFYHHNLREIPSARALLSITPEDVRRDAESAGALNLTKVDTVRIAQDLVGRGLLDPETLRALLVDHQHPPVVPPILHANQYVHLALWLKDKGMISDDRLRSILEAMPEVRFTEI